MHPLIITTLLASSTLLSLSMVFCAPIPSAEKCEIVHCDQVMGAIGKLKGEITSDPQGVTETWGDGQKHSTSSEHHTTNEHTTTSNEKKEEEKKEGLPDVCKQSKPGQNGVFHSSGHHGSDNWEEARRKAGCPV